MRRTELLEFGRAREDAGRLHLPDELGGEQRLAFEFASGQQEFHPVGNGGNRGDDRAGGRRRNRKKFAAPAFVVAFHQIGNGGIISRGVLCGRKADRHLQFVREPGADEFLITLAANALGDEAGDVIGEIVVLKFGPDIPGRLEVTQGRHHLGAREIAGNPDPVVAGQAGMVAEQVAHRDALGRDRIVQAEFGNVVADGPAPVETSLVDQQRQGGGGKRLGDRADQELRLRCRRKASFRVALAPGLEQGGLAVLYDRERDSRHLPLRHRFRRQRVELRRKGGD